MGRMRADTQNRLGSGRGFVTLVNDGVFVDVCGVGGEQRSGHPGRRDCEHDAAFARGAALLAGFARHYGSDRTAGGADQTHMQKNFARLLNEEAKRIG